MWFLDAGLIVAAYQVNIRPTAVLIVTNGRIVKSTNTASLTVLYMLAWLEHAEPA
jgi:hypothetical protein